MPNNEAHLYDLLSQYEDQKKELNRLPIYTGYDDFTRRQNDGERQRIAEAMKRIETEIHKVTHRYHPALVAPDIDILIANIKMHVEAPQMPEQAWEFDPAR